MGIARLSESAQTKVNVSEPKQPVNTSSTPQSPDLPIDSQRVRQPIASPAGILASRAPNPDQLLTWVAVAEAGNISRAARQLNLSQPAVSAQLKSLQAWFGGAIYRRQGQGVALTEAGLALLVHARRVRAAVQDASLLRDAFRGLDAGTLRLGASTTPASYLLPPIVAAFRQAYPAIALHLSDGNTREIIDRLDQLDLAFIEGTVPETLPRNTSVVPWCEDDVVAIVHAGHPLATLRAATLADIAAYAWVTREPGSGLRYLVERTFAQAGYAPTSTLELAGVEAVKHAVRAGLGVGFVSSLSMQHEDGTLVPLAIGEAGLRRTISALMVHADAPNRATLKFLDYLNLNPSVSLKTTQA